MKKKSSTEKRECGQFLSGVLVLSLSTVIVKVIGLAYKIPMIAYLGAEGMGYFNSAAEIYATLCVIATAGLPVALSMLISANRERGDADAVRRIERLARIVFLLLGSVGTACMLLLAEPISRWIGSPNAYLCMLAIAPALFFVCFSSSVRGFFQGLGRMAPTAISQLLEALGKLIFGVGLASAALARGLALEVVAAFAVLGLSLGTFCSSLYLLLARVFFLREKGRPQSESVSESSDGRLSTLLRIAVPITVSSVVLSLTRLSDMALMLRRLQDAGMSVAEANVIYGSYTTLAVPVFSLIPSLITPIALVSVPRLAAAIEARSERTQLQIIDEAIRFTVLLSMPAAMGIAAYARPILTVLFVKEAEAVAIASPLLSVLGISIFFSGMITATNAILQAYRRTVCPILSMAAGVAVKLVSEYLLLGLETVGAYGAPVSTLLCDLTVTVINLCCIGRRVPRCRQGEGVLRVYWKPFLASALSILASLAVYAPLRRASGEGTAFFAACGIAAVGYGALLLLFGGLSTEDIAMLPMGARLLRRWERFRYKREKKKSNIKDGMTK